MWTTATLAPERTRKSGPGDRSAHERFVAKAVVRIVAPGCSKRS